MLDLAHPASPSLDRDVSPRRSSRVPAEFVGLARAFRNRVDAADRAIRPALRAVARPLEQRLTRHPMLRAEHLVDAEREWRRRMPAEFRLGDVAVQRSRSAFSISETRLVTHKIRLSSWSEEESGVAVYVCGLRLIDGRLKPSTTRITTAIGLHAIARRYERGIDRSDAAVLADLALLAGPDTDALQVAGWVAGVVTAATGSGDRYPLRSVRTWIGRD